ncbi:lysophospholipid acyltransferase family protein [Granulicella sp. dw_53]|uniref:lysophospholipid acyltransferase family protein n=1 Tax=Granulicella sp. dw_53 TaxID=2719792 RepID=UPI001BD6A49D|nr:lysophospholipid acyltransferase family protein [Granulicella sp. dw_53]
MKAPTISRLMLWFFRRIVHRYVRRHFHGVRLLGAERLTAAAADGGPLIIYANHGSWWDPMVSFLLAERLMKAKRHYAPMDAKELERYRILKYVGIFPVEMKTARGAIQFLRSGEEILRARGVLWVTPQGRFVDARERPLELKRGLAALAVRVAAREGGCTVQPLAIEYPFWDERLPECLLEFGDAVSVTAGEEEGPVQQRLVAGLEAAMENLKSRALLRDATQFRSLEVGRAGTGGVYGFGQWLKAKISRRSHWTEPAAAVASALEKERNRGA